MGGTYKYEVVTRRRWSCRSPRDTQDGRSVHLDRICVGLAPLRVRTGAAMSVMGISGCTEPERSQTLCIAHGRARFATSQVEPHKSTTQSSAITKPADVCGTLGDARESSEL